MLRPHRRATVAEVCFEQFIFIVLSSVIFFIERRARQFEGAWSYLEVLAESLGDDDPLSSDVVEAYWVGSELLDRVDPAALVTRRP